MTTARIALVFAVSLVASDIGAQTDTLIPPSAYAARRTKLARAVGNAAIIVPGRHLVGQHELPRQDADFWYLTGVESPYAVLVMSGGRTVLFLPDTFEFAGAQFPMVDSGFRRAAVTSAMPRSTGSRAMSAREGRATSASVCPASKSLSAFSSAQNARWCQSVAVV